MSLFSFFKSFFPPFSPLLLVSSRLLIHSFGCCWVNNILWCLSVNVLGCQVYRWCVPIYFISLLNFPLKRSWLLTWLLNVPSGQWHQRQQCLCRCTGIWLAPWVPEAGTGLIMSPPIGRKKKKSCEVCSLLLTGIEQLVFSFEEHLYLTLGRQTAISVCKWIQLFKCTGQKMKGILFKQCAPKSQMIFLMSVFCKWKFSIFQH